MPIVLTSSIFLLIATLPGVVGITLPQPLIDWCNKLYNFTMGVMGIMVAGTTAKELYGFHEPSPARRQSAQRRFHHGGRPVQHAAARSHSSPPSSTAPELSVFDCTSMGTRGLFSAYIAAFITVGSISSVSRAIDY